MNYCPKCKNRYPDDFAFCLLDGESLKTSGPEAQTLKMNPEGVQKAKAVFGGPADLNSPSVEYIVKKVWVDEGSYFDFEANTNTARISVKEIVEDTFISGPFSKGKEYGVAIEVGGINPMHGGIETKPVGVEGYLIPVKRVGEEKRSIFSFYAHERISLFFRILVEQIDTHHRRAELNIAYLWFGKS